MSKCQEMLSSCVMQRGQRLLRAKLRDPSRVEALVRDMRERGYRSHSWQYVKRILADAVVECLVEAGGVCLDGCLREIYLADMTGGEHSYIQGHGGKDQDIVIYAPCRHLDRERLENEIEGSIEPVARIIIEEVLGINPIEVLGIPNVIEIHIVRDERDTPYWNMINSKLARLVRVWPPRREPTRQVFPF